MGCYIQGPAHGKGPHMVATHGAVAVPKPAKFSDVPADKALICVVNNGPFEAAALCYSQGEFDEFTRADDHRAKDFYLMDKAKAHELSGYKER